MEQLIKITDYNGSKAVSARELHAFLESKQDFSNWIKNLIEKYGFIESQDYASFNKIIEREILGNIEKQVNSAVTSLLEKSNQDAVKTPQPPCVFQQGGRQRICLFALLACCSRLAYR